MSKSNLKFILLILFLIAAWQLGSNFNIDDSQYEEFLTQFPLYLSGLLYIVLYVGITFFAWMAKDIFKIVGAILFGAYVSTLLVWIAEMGNVFVMFHFSRKLGREYVESKLKGKLASLDDKIDQSGFWGLFILRAFPLVPFRFMDLAAGLTKISFRKYFWIVFISSPLRIFWVQFILAGVGKAIFQRPQVLLEYLAENTAVLIWSVVYLVMAVILAFVVKKRWR